MLIRDTDAMWAFQKAHRDAAVAEIRRSRLVLRSRRRARLSLKQKPDLLYKPLLKVTCDLYPAVC